MYDPIGAAVVLLDQLAPTKGILSQADPADPRRRTFVVPTVNNRKQYVYAIPVPDQLFGERLDLVSIAVQNLPLDAGLLVRLLATAHELRRARICVLTPVPPGQPPQLAVMASFVAEEVYDGSGPRLLHAVREVAAVADSLELLITGVDVS